MVDMTQEREERARETIETLNTEIQNLTKVIEEKTLGAEDTNLNELRKLRDELTSQRDNLKIEVKELTALIDTKEEEISSVLESWPTEIRIIESHGDQYHFPPAFKLTALKVIMTVKEDQFEQIVKA